MRSIVPSLLFLALLGSAPAPAETSETYGDDYAVGTYGRVRYEENGASITRAETEAPGEGLRATANMAVFPGDSVATGPDQRLEVQLAQGSLVRVDRGTQLTFLSLPDPYAEHRDHTVLQLAAGVVRVAAALAVAEEFRIDTPAASVYLLGDADLRVEVTGDGRTRVESRRGVAEVAAGGGSILLRGGMRAQVRPGAVPDAAVAFNTFEADEFDRWVELLDEEYRERAAGTGSEAYESLPTEVRPHYVELSSQGDWIESDDYGWVWTPDSVGSDWRPYQQGYWDYGPSGYFWVSSEPWGWAPYHYGRWAWVAGNGYCWIPGRVFGGAWVSWSWGTSYVGWSALDPWGYAVHYGPLMYGYYDPYTWVFATYPYFYYYGDDHGGCHSDHGHHHGHGYGDHYTSVDHAGESVRDNAIVTRPPRSSPRELSQSSEARARAVRDTQVERDGRTERGQVARTASPRFDAVERGIIARDGRTRVASAERAAPRPASGAAATTGRTPAPTAGRRPVAAPPTYPRVQTVPNRTRPAAPARPTARPAARPSVVPSRPTLPATARPQAAARVPVSSSAARVESRPSQSGSRLGEMYKSLARPRQTVTAAPSAPRPSATGRQVAPPTRRPATRSVHPQPQSRPTSPQARPQPRPAAPQARPQATQRSSAPQSRPSAQHSPQRSSGAPSRTGGSAAHGSHGRGSR